MNPTMTPSIKRPKAGFTAYAERLNGRAAMVGMVSMVLIEYFTGQPLLHLLGIV